MSLLNLAILAHVDAGKTSLTERLLHDAGVIDRVGTVDAGTTRTDTLELERARGITIKAAVVAFPIGEVTVTLIDTPGHPDFIAEVERVLGVLDGAVLVVSAVEGVQAQTRVLMRTLTRLRIPTLIFVNKIDRRGARTGALLAELTRRLTPAVVPTTTVRAAGTRDAEVLPAALPAEVLAEHDDQLLRAVVTDQPVPEADLRRALAAQTRRALIHPVFFGSASTGAGVAELAAGIADLLPAAAGDPAGPLSGTVFKVERGPAGEKIAYARLFSGTLHVRDRPAADPAHRITAIGVVTAAGTERRPAVTAGHIARLWGLPGIRIGDPLGDAAAGTGRHFAPPSLETVIAPEHERDRGALYAALTELADQDPLIGLRRDDTRQELSLSLYGEIQKEVIEATLAADHGLRVRFAPTTIICTEQLTGTGQAVERHHTPGNPFLATVGLRVAPADAVSFRLGVELGSMPPAFFKAVEEAVHETLTQGLYGWQVTGCAVTMTHAGYLARQSHAHGTFDKSMSSTAGDFRLLTPLVLTDALRRAGTRVHEPVHRCTLELPADTLGAVLPVLGALRGIPLQTRQDGEVCLVEGELPAAHVHDLRRQLPALTRGEGVLDTAFDHYAPVTGRIPQRPRTGDDPHDRKEYLLRVVRRVR